MSETADRVHPTDHRMAIFGAGTMGAGITTLALGHGIPVTLVDTDYGTLERACTRIAHQTRAAQLMGAFPADTEPAESTAADSPDAVAAPTPVRAGVPGDHHTNAHRV